MISPYKSNNLVSTLVGADRKNEILSKIGDYKSIVCTSSAAANAVMMGSGYFSPLKGYMSLKDALSTYFLASSMQTKIHWHATSSSIPKATTATRRFFNTAIKRSSKEKAFSFSDATPSKSFGTMRGACSGVCARFRPCPVAVASAVFTTAAG